MKMKFVILGLISSVVSLPALELKKQRIGFKWNLKNNCGPRPTGPIWPHPPLNTNHNPQLPMHCDMLHEDLYVQGYACNTTCQAEPEVQVQVQCDCLRRVMGLTFPQPCKWVTKTMEGNSTDCASVPATLPQFDWQCDPRNETCADGQYGEPIISEYREYIPPPTEAPEPEIVEEEASGNSTDFEGSGSGDDEIPEEEKAMKSVELITNLLKKEQEVIKAAEHMKKDYEKLLHDQKVESILYDQLGTDCSTRPEINFHRKIRSVMIHEPALASVIIVYPKFAPNLSVSLKQDGLHHQRKSQMPTLSPNGTQSRFTAMHQTPLLLAVMKYSKRWRKLARRQVRQHRLLRPLQRSKRLTSTMRPLLRQQLCRAQWHRL